MKKYLPKDIEHKWQQKWAESKLYRADDSSSKPKKYILDMFPYPSGDGLHVGHFKIYTASDFLTRYFRLRGFNVLHPMGWDAFGLPAENYAIKTGIHPSITTAKNITHIKEQMQMSGLSYNWDREINTTDPNYYKWTQWIFLKLFEKGLAYEDEAPINWCPKDKTGLANEEVVNGKCERCGTPVERRNIRQWILKITDYADKLTEGLEGLDWPSFIKDMQVNWIGRSEGALVSFSSDSKEIDNLEVFTTRPDTLFGVTFVVLSPEHSKLEQYVTQEQRTQVESYKEKALNKSEIERKENKEKTGVFTGSYVINPVNGQKIPVWVADYVLMGYGTGAIMAVPAHDQRDFEFAQKFSLPIIQVIAKDGQPIEHLNKAYEEEGLLTNSGEFNGLGSKEAINKVTEYLSQHKLGEKRMEYHLRDWIFSRQRYWGEPIPLVHCHKCGIVPLSEDQLPLKLPEVKEYEPTGTGESPLAKVEEWVNTTCPKCQGPARRETNTMPQWAGSCWYYLRFIDPHNDQHLVNPEKEKYWMPVDWYIGGAEHAVLHLLYSRFWHKVLYELGVVSTSEPFQKLSSVGLVLATDGRKMSKSLGNVVTPDQIINEYGADTLRVYEGFMGPFENAISWDPTSINGVYKFLTRIWEVVNSESTDTLTNTKMSSLSTLENGESSSYLSEAKRALAHLKTIEVALNKLITKVGSDIENMKFNTAIASMMEFINLVYHEKLTLDQKKRFLVILSPFAPHLTEELWSDLDQPFSIHQQNWPKVDEKFLQEDRVVVVIQVNGKVRDQITIETNLIQNKEKLISQAQESPKIQKFIEGKEIKKSIYVPGKVLNFVV